MIPAGGGDAAKSRAIEDASSRRVRLVQDKGSSAVYPRWTLRSVMPKR